MKVIWKARKAHRSKCMDRRIQEITQNPQKGRYGKTSQTPGAPARKECPYMRGADGNPKRVEL
eukprot:10264991-Alexandrium_andersonii.AAC.1